MVEPTTLSLSSCMEMMDLLPGFRFVPTDGELVGYLRDKKSKPEDGKIIPEYDIYQCNPEQIPRTFKYGLANESFYYTQTKPRHSKGQRRDRKAGNGSWRVTCGSRSIKNACGDVVGYKKKLVFLEHLGERKKRKTEWMMDEYSLQDMNNCALCRIYRQANRRVPTIPNDGNSTKDPTERSKLDKSTISPQQPPNSRVGMESFPWPPLDNGYNFDDEWYISSESFWLQECSDISTLV